MLGRLKEKCSIVLARISTISKDRAHTHYRMTNRDTQNTKNLPDNHYQFEYIEVTPDSKWDKRCVRCNEILTKNLKFIIVKTKKESQEGVFCCCECFSKEFKVVRVNYPGTYYPQS
jgi:hypothetical protein